MYLKISVPISSASPLFARRILHRLGLLLLLAGLLAGPVAGQVLPQSTQSRAVDSLMQLLASPQADTSRVLLLCQLSD